jgi:arsenate reductase
VRGCNHRSKDLALYLEAGVDTVITVCAEANAACPEFPIPVRRYHWQFADPAKFDGEDSEVLARFREIRDQIRQTFGAYVGQVQFPRKTTGKQMDMAG